MGLLALSFPHSNNPALSEHNPRLLEENRPLIPLSTRVSLILLTRQPGIVVRQKTDNPNQRTTYVGVMLTLCWALFNRSFLQLEI